MGFMSIGGAGYLVQKIGEELPRVPFLYSGQSFVIRPEAAGYVVYHWSARSWARYDETVHRDQHAAFNHVYEAESARWAEMERALRDK